MCASIHFNSLISVESWHQRSFLDSASRIMQRIEEIAISIFNRMSAFFNSYNKYSNENNLKTFAFISFLSIIALVVIAKLRGGDSQTILPPPEATKH
jgi:hypothetical protein